MRKVVPSNYETFRKLNQINTWTLLQSIYIVIPGTLLTFMDIID